MKNFLRKLFGEPKKEQLWCNYVATLGQDEHTHPFHFHQTVKEEFNQERGTHTFVDVCKRMRTFRVWVEHYTQV